VRGSPTLIKRQVKTTITVSDGEVLLLGGLNDSQSSDGSSGLAFLPATWAVKSNNSTQTQFLLVLSARINN
jgi:general secretion pathway protein D